MKGAGFAVAFMTCMNDEPTARESNWPRRSPSRGVGVSTRVL